MKLPFLDREDETARLRRLVSMSEGSLGVLYGRRRCGKSRLLREVLPRARSVYYVGDDREAALQRASLATEIGRLVGGFDRVVYPDWESLLERWWSQAERGSILALDEFPALVSSAREIPSLLQKYLDRDSSKGVHLLLAGSSQLMMQGLVLDRTAPLYGRATEILNIAPLEAGWIRKALRPRDAVRAVEAYAVWGGTPRYWELAADYPDLATAIESLVLSPLGVLYEEPTRLLRDDLRDTAQAASILALIGQGCHRASEIAARLEKPATSLSRPLQRLLELGLIKRETPFGTTLRDSKRTRYRISDPFTLYWFRFVEPNRSRLEAGLEATVARAIADRFAQHVGEIWEELARRSVPLLDCHKRNWGPAGRWWGPGLDRKPMEIDLVAESDDGEAVLVGEVKWTTRGDCARLLNRLKAKAANLPLAQGRKVLPALWLKSSERRIAGAEILTPRRVFDVLR